jgi:signal transduction histidine kinase/CheY-like chemotaxis protein
MRRLAENGPQREVSERVEIQVADRGGRRFPAELSISTPVKVDGAELYTAYIRDLTREKRSQRRVRELRRDLLHVIQENPDGMAVYGEPGLMFANRAWERWFDSERSGEELTQLVISEERGELEEALLGARAGGVPARLGEYRFLDREAETLVLDLHAVPGIHFEGREAMLVVARDVTVQQQMRSRLAIADRMAAMGTLLAGVAHEINNPLTYVIGNLSLVELELDDLGASPRLRQAMSDANDGADRICEIVRDLQKLSRDESGPPKPIDVNGAIRSALKVVHNKVKYIARVDADLGDVSLVMGSEGRVAQVVLNLVVNAVQSFPRSDTEANLIQVRSRQAMGKRVCIEVRDNGPGIPEAHLDRIFDPFFTTKPVGQGTGLGLAICHNIVSAFDGEIAVDSRPGVGTTFRFWLNQAGRAVEPAIDADGLPEARRSARVLVVDDEPRILRSYRHVLDAHEVEVARSADDALAALSSDDDIDLILCDIAMPGMNGIELFRRVRELHPHNADRFVFVTGTFDDNTRSTVAELGTDMLEKPVDPAALRELARVAARERGLEHTPV